MRGPSDIHDRKTHCRHLVNGGLMEWFTLQSEKKEKIYIYTVLHKINL